VMPFPDRSQRSSKRSISGRAFDRLGRGRSRRERLHGMRNGFRLIEDLDP
jgi:hypothetical protein